MTVVADDGKKTTKDVNNGKVRYNQPAVMVDGDGDQQHT